MATNLDQLLHSEGHFSSLARCWHHHWVIKRPFHHSCKLIVSGRWKTWENQWALWSQTLFHISVSVKWAPVSEVMQHVVSGEWTYSGNPWMIVSVEALEAGEENLYPELTISFSENKALSFPGLKQYALINLPLSIWPILWGMVLYWKYSIGFWCWQFEQWGVAIARLTSASRSPCCWVCA